MSKANVTIIEAQMGEGKTLTATAIVTDNVFANVYGIASPVTGIYYRVEPYRLDWVRILEGEQAGKIVKIPSDFKIYSRAQVFANYHLFGIPYVYADPATMIEHLNSGLITSGDLIIDEGYIAGDARKGMNSLSILMTWFGQQMRKRDINLYVIVQHGRFIDWRFRYIAKRKILCSYDEGSLKIRLLIQNLAKGTERFLSFYGPTYWRFYDTNELPQIPERMIEKAAGWAK